MESLPPIVFSVLLLLALGTIFTLEPPERNIAGLPTQDLPDEQVIALLTAAPEHCAAPGCTVTVAWTSIGPELHVQLWAASLLACSPVGEDGSIVIPVSARTEFSIYQASGCAPQDIMGGPLERIVVTVPDAYSQEQAERIRSISSRRAR